MNDEELSSLTVTGRIVEQPRFTETVTGDSLAWFCVQLGDNLIECEAVGPLADNLRKFGGVGVEVLGCGRLGWRPGSERPHVRLQRLAFTSPKEVAEILGWNL
jgi:hypothetical protein